MKKILYILFTVITLSISVTSCSSDESSIGGEGKVNLSMVINDDIVNFSRSGADDAVAQNCTIYIYSGKGLIRKFHGLNEVPADLWLVSGGYKALAWTGDSVDASFDKKFYKGSTDFTVSKDQVAQVVLNCKIQNVVTSVSIDESIGNALTDYTVTISNSKGSLAFNAENMSTAKGYFMMPPADTELSWTLTGKQVNGSDYTLSGKISNPKRSTEYTLRFSYNPTVGEVGGALISVAIDETEAEVNDNVVINGAPKILGIGFDITNPVYSEYGNFKAKVSLWAAASAAITGCEISCDYFETAGLPANVIDFAQISSAGAENLAALGLTWQYAYNESNATSTAKISFSKDLLNVLPLGEYIINVKVTDANGKTRITPFNIIISDAKVVTNEVERTSIFATHATIRGNIAKEGATNAAFNFRKKGETKWTTIAATTSGVVFSAPLTGLTSNTTYQYVAKCDDFVGTDIKEFTTEAKYIIPNASFEDWYTASDGALMPMASGSKFWDTGNHGSAKMNKNVTTSDNSIKNSGEKSIKLSSQFVGVGIIGKFAAGNLFAGEFLNVDMSDMSASMNFGMSFNGSRPSKLALYMKYVPGTVDYESSGRIKKGDTDMGHIYVALSDLGKPWAINSKTQTFFDKNAADVIAYGEIIQTTATDGMVRIEIPLSYNSNTRIPTHLIFVAAASRYGDYFAGSTSSVMWLDDLEFIYE